jgi:hypothetical protein
MSQMTDEELIKRSKDIVDFLSEKDEEARKLGEDQHIHFYTSVAHTLGALAGFDFKALGYGPMMGLLMESMTDGLQTAMQAKGINGTIIKVKK